MTPISRRFSALPALDAGRDAAVGIVAGIVVVAVCTGLIYPLKQVAPADSLGVVYMVGVLIVSAAWGVWLGVIAAVESALAFDYFHLPPLGSLSVQHGSDWVALGAFLIAATLGGYVARVARSRSDVVASRARIIAAADGARQRLARDLHDGAQQRLVTTLVNLQLADQQFDSDPVGARELLQAALKETGDTISEVRELAHGVHPAILTNRGLGAAAGALAARSSLPVEAHPAREPRWARHPPARHRNPAARPRARPLMCRRGGSRAIGPGALPSAGQSSGSDRRSAWRRRRRSAHR